MMINANAEYLFLCREAYDRDDGKWMISDAEGTPAPTSRHLR